MKRQISRKVLAKDEVSLEGKGHVKVRKGVKTGKNGVKHSR